MRATAAERAKERRAARPRLRAWLAAGLMLASASSSGDASAGDALCRAAPAIEPTSSIDATLTAADAAQASPLERPRARALYLAVLARDPADEEAAIGLARTDAMDECFALAERGYRDVLARSPGNVDARAGLADVLIWTGRWREAEKELDRGLSHAPFAPDLLARRGRVAFLRGDPATARFFLSEAGHVAPLDPEIQQARDRIFVGQARLGQRVQVFPSGYDDLYTTSTSAMFRWQRLRFEAGAEVVARHGAARASRSGPVRSTVIDGRPTFGVYHHFGSGAWVGGAVGLSAPALALPARALTLSGFTPIDRRFSAQLLTAYWQYRDDRDVAILSPALSVAITDAIDATARYWLTTVIAPTPSGETDVEHVHSAGARVSWRPSPRLSVGLDYTYGVQLERNPTATELLDLRSHVVSVLGLVLVDRSFGVDGAISFERRLGRGRAPDVWGPAVEVGVFTRW